MTVYYPHMKKVGTTLNTDLSSALTLGKSAAGNADPCAITPSSHAQQLPLPDQIRFDGSTYLPWRDDCRLVGQMRRVWDAMVDGRWYTPEQLEALTGDRWASISAQQRHLRKDRFGAHTVEKRQTADSKGGSFEYRLVINPNAAAVMAAAEKKSHHRGVSAQPATAGVSPSASRSIASEWD